MAGQGSIAVPQQHPRTSIFQRRDELSGTDQAGKTTPDPGLSATASLLHAGKRELPRLRPVPSVFQLRHGLQAYRSDSGGASA